MYKEESKVCCELRDQNNITDLIKQFKEILSNRSFENHVFDALLNTYELLVTPYSDIAKLPYNKALKIHKKLLNIFSNKLFDIRYLLHATLGNREANDMFFELLLKYDIDHLINICKINLLLIPSGTLTWFVLNKLASSELNRVIHDVSNDVYYRAYKFQSHSVYDNNVAEFIKELVWQNKEAALAILTEYKDEIRQIKSELADKTKIDQLTKVSDAKDIKKTQYYKNLIDKTVTYEAMLFLFGLLSALIVICCILSKISQK